MDQILEFHVKIRTIGLAVVSRFCEWPANAAFASFFTGFTTGDLNGTAFRGLQPLTGDVLV